ncbi:MAG: 2-oxoglutarate dehydrogenase complex dihydrolipoyllysine-residue succinyltransferase [Gammaproteobacteria bacterium]|nr:2-oxoglutarate dehydrogenase complex dihydrolipoyllysine-residue succinyltransferase [Gammaproteobacteria bacterium]MCY4313388.1 2-oxoglutarate dehydrogenase complex dihydrolipoyllysine-residue succinyltransferase [Gammaproteobacteria bacterium]
MIEIKVPILPESVSDALLLDWHKSAGEPVMRDEILVEVETDKVVLEVPAPEDGILSEIVEQAGATVNAEQVLAKLAPGSVEPEATESKAVEVPSPVQESSAGTDDVRLSPAARRIVDEQGLDATRIAGTGKDGLITKQDALEYSSAGSKPVASDPGTEKPSAGASTPASTSQALNRPAPQGDREEIREPMSRLRQTIANRLIQSQQGAALLTTFNEVDMKAVMGLRSRYKDQFEKEHGIRLGFMSFFVRASVVALKRFPLVNAYIDGTDIVRHLYQDIGIAVASPRGLVVPVLRNCESMSNSDIEKQINDFGVRARDGKITMDELSGGTFTITNGGVFGSLLSTPIVNPPQSAILGMHKIQERPMVIDGEVQARPMMYLALSYDHRIIDGKEAVQFLVTIKDMIEDPARLLLDC